MCVKVLHYEYPMLIKMKLLLRFFPCEIIFFHIIYTEGKHHVLNVRLGGTTMKKNHNLIVDSYHF